MQDYKRAFIKFAIEAEVLSFGEFTLKSGRVSPYFFNAGEFKTGGALSRLGRYYADALVDSGLHADCLFGPAYKGIPLVAATAIAMAEGHQTDIPYVYNRKEAKAHGEGGLLVGAALAGDVVIIDDVITAGTAIGEVMAMIGPTDASVSGVVVAIDREERGQGAQSAIQEVESNYGIRVVSVVSLSDIMAYLDEQGSYEQELNMIGSYRAQYGIASSP